MIYPIDGLVCIEMQFTGVDIFNNPPAFVFLVSFFAFREKCCAFFNALAHVILVAPWTGRMWEYDGTLWNFSGLEIFHLNNWVFIFGRFSLFSICVLCDTIQELLVYDLRSSILLCCEGETKPLPSTIFCSCITRKMVVSWDVCCSFTVDFSDFVCSELQFPICCQLLLVDCELFQSHQKLIVLVWSLLWEPIILFHQCMPMTVCPWTH